MPWMLLTRASKGNVSVFIGVAGDSGDCALSVSAPFPQNVMALNIPLPPSVAPIAWSFRRDAESRTVQDVTTSSLPHTT